MGYVYFIQIISSGEIKIGYSTNVKKRMNGLQTAIPEKIKLLGFFAGDKQKEKELHKKFKHLRIKGEWFKCDASIIDLINSCNELTFQNNMAIHIELLEDGKTVNMYSKMSNVFRKEDIDECLL